MENLNFQSFTQFSIFIGKKQEMKIMAAEIENLVSCPFFQFDVFNCLNPEYMKE